MDNEPYDIGHSNQSHLMINGIEHTLCTDGRYRVVEHVVDEPYESDDEDSLYQPRESTHEAKRNRRPSLSKPTKIMLGGLVVGMFVVPLAVHTATEQVTNYLVNTADPREDRTITQDELISDLGKSAEELGPKNIGRILGGGR